MSVSPFPRLPPTSWQSEAAKGASLLGASTTRNSLPRATVALSSAANSHTWLYPFGPGAEYAFFISRQAIRITPGSTSANTTSAAATSTNEQYKAGITAGSSKINRKAYFRARLERKELGSVAATNLREESAETLF